MLLINLRGFTDFITKTSSLHDILKLYILMTPIDLNEINKVVTPFCHVNIFLLRTLEYFLHSMHWYAFVYAFVL